MNVFTYIFRILIHTFRILRTHAVCECVCESAAVADAVASVDACYCCCCRCCCCCYCNVIAVFRFGPIFVMAFRTHGLTALVHISIKPADDSMRSHHFIGNWATNQIDERLDIFRSYFMRIFAYCLL